MQNITSEQRHLIERLRQAAPGLTLRWDESRGVVRLARGAGLVRRQAPDKVSGTLQAFLSEYRGLFGPPDLAKRLQQLRASTDRLGWTHLELQQRHPVPGLSKREPSVEVYGSRLAAHFIPEGDLVEVQSNCWRDVPAVARPRLTAAAVQRLLAAAAAAAPGYAELARRARSKGARLDFPVGGAPQLVLYPWHGGFRLAWTVCAYCAVPVTGPSGQATGLRRLEPGDVFVDAATGEQFLFFPARMHVASSGLGVTPLGGPYVSRPLNVEQVGTTAIHRLADRTRARAIITFDAACGYSGLTEIAQAIADGTLPVSENLTGPNWTRVAQNTGDTERTASQQPEVDAHFFCAEAYDWYDALAGGRAGWDDGAFPGRVEANLPVRAVAHARGTDTGSCRSARSQFWRVFIASRWLPFLVFPDGDRSGTVTPRPVDYLAGVKAIVGHEYQHAITYFSFRNGAGDPGIGYFGWAAALHEGLSDTFGCLFARSWKLGTEVSPDVPPSVIRNLVYPRDPDSWENRPGGAGHDNHDHFDDRTLPYSTPPSSGSAGAYDHGTILAHVAFLLGAGGVHQRLVRTPRLIPIYALGDETLGGKAIPKAARIYYHALTYFSATLGQVTDSVIDEELFHGFRDACESAAIALYGQSTREHRSTILAFYAVGLKPPDVSYGPDLTFLRWGWSWRLSREYLGGIHSTSPDWASLDLFINNGGVSAWNAIVNVLDATGNPTRFENRLYCRVRNVGDQDASNVIVNFFYAKAGTGVVSWQPVTDKDGVVQTLTLAALPAGQMNFPEADQDAPPAAASVKWYIPPLAPGESVDHFCLKAILASPDDVNPFNNEVQSNIAYVAYAPGASRSFGFFAGNPWDEEIPMEFRTDSELPRGWRVRIEGAPDKGRLRGRQERPLKLVLDFSPDSGRLEPPFDGEVRGRLEGSLAGRCAGALTRASADGERLSGRVALDVNGLGVLLGAFEGKLDPGSGDLDGQVTGVFQTTCDRKGQRVGVVLRGTLRPWRRVHVQQLPASERLGGITFQVQGERSHH